MAENLTEAALPQGSFDSINATFGQTASPKFSGHFDLIFLQMKLVLSALGIIYVGAHASLRRPPSAAPTKDKKEGEKDEDDGNFSQGLEPSDAILFPVMAAVVLIGLYYLIQWLKDPDVLNKILRWYMSVLSIASLMAMYSHGIEVVTTLVFPAYWRGRDGALRMVDQKARSVKRCDDAGNVTEADAELKSPLPGLLGLVTQSEALRKASWELRGLLTRQWKLKVFLHGMGKEEEKIKFAHVMSLFMSLATAIIYSSVPSNSLANMMGYGMSYGSLILLSPTNFLTSTLVLVGLFFYDIIMVFYTPFMVTVATKLEAPIKLTFGDAGKKSILGLGDIVVPGIVIALALRFDLWMHYERKIKYESTDLKLVEKDASGAIVTKSEIKHKEVKKRYVNAKGSWGEKLWVRGAMFLSRPQQVPATLAATRFPKTYFYASMAGYTIGMLVTLAVLVVYRRGQPALLYLVPGVLGSLWLTGLLRGEIGQMGKYTEDGSIDTTDVVVDLDASGKAIKTIGKLENGVVDTTKKDEDDKKDKDAEKEADKEKDKQSKSAKGNQKVFLISIEVPSDDEDA